MALPFSLRSNGYSVAAVHNVKTEPAEFLAAEVGDCKIAVATQDVAYAAEPVFITTVDGQITKVASETYWKKGQMVVKCTGVNNTVVLELARKQGAPVGVFHPLNSFADKTQAIQKMAGNTFDI